MTIEQLLEMNASTLENLTDAQLLEYFRPYLSACRPINSSINLKGSIKQKNDRSKLDSTIEAARKILENFKLQ